MVALNTFRPSTQIENPDGTAAFFGTAGTSADPSYSISSPSSSAVAGIAPTTNITGWDRDVKATPCNLYSAYAIAGATAGFLIAYNAAAMPAQGAALTPTLILGAAAVPANGTGTIEGTTVPARYSIGCMLLFSTTLATYTRPATACVIIYGKAA